MKSKSKSKVAPVASAEQEGTTSKFWMIYRTDSSVERSPTKMHSFLTLAKDEANRLAKKHPGGRFAVLEAVEVCVATINPPQTLKCVKDDSPF